MIWKCRVVLVSIFLLVSSQGQAQDVDSFTVKGTIQNPISSAIMGSFLPFDPATGNYKLISKTDESFTCHRESYVFPSSQPKEFSFEGLQISKAKNQASIFIVDQTNTVGGRYTLDKRDASQHVFTIPNVHLEKLYSVKGNVKVPDQPSHNAKESLSISVAETDDRGAQWLVAVTYATPDNTFQLKLPPGNYTFFFDFDDNDGNPGRVTEKEIITDHSIRVPNILLISNLKKWIKKNSSIQSLSKNFDDKSLINLIHPNHKIVMFYFFAGYCGPCLSDQGIAKYLKLASENPDDIEVIVIHSDSYGYTNGTCPMSEKEMLDWMKGPNLAKKAWLTLDQHLMDAQSAGADVHLLWSPPSTAKKMSIDAYPTVFVYKDGKIIGQPTIGTSDTLSDKILSLIQH